MARNLRSDLSWRNPQRGGLGPQEDCTQPVLSSLGGRELQLPLSTRQSGWLMFWTPVVRAALISKGSSLHKAMLVP